MQTIAIDLIHFARHLCEENIYRNYLGVTQMFWLFTNLLDTDDPDDIFLLVMMILEYCTQTHIKSCRLLRGGASYQCFVYLFDGRDADTRKHVEY